MNSSPPEGSHPMASPHALKRSIPLLAVLCLILIGGLGAFGWSYAQINSERLLPGITIAGTPVGKQLPKTAEKLVETQLNQQFKEGIQVQLDNHPVSLGNPKGLITYDVSRAVKEAGLLGHTGPFVHRLLAPLKGRLFGYEIAIHAEINETELAKRVTSSLGDKLAPPKDAELIVQPSATSSEIALFITPEKTGVTINIQTLKEKLETQTNTGSNQPILLTAQTHTAQITKTDLEPLIPAVERWLSKSDFTLQTEDAQWAIKNTDIASWITVNTSTIPLSIQLDPILVKNNLRIRAKDFLQPVKNGLIQVDASSTVIAFEEPIQGIDIDTSKTIENILSGWEHNSSTINLVLTKVSPNILGDGARLGIEEVIGVGRSNFSGSPSNRRRNIALGAKKVHQTLLAPGDEFSMLKTLGEIDGEHGWLPELVIKGNKTTPEFGGGLCQVGTTMFRAALASGLPITARQNHSYRVRYYEPAGTDATIYDPAPDFKFKNDTANSLLITTSIKGDEMAFTVWGKKDGRLAEQTTPRIYNIVPPPPKKVVETLDLPPGKEKCTETAHAGADAEFTYTVTYPDGNIAKQTFKSHYKPWQAVCLKGVTELTQPASSVDETGVNNPNL